MEFELNGVCLFYEEKGQGIPVILVHGYPLDHTIWSPVADLLSENARVILPDLRGFGRSPAPGAVISMQRLADDLLGLMDHLGIQRAVLAGHSMGGYACLAFAKAYPERLSGLALVSTQAGADSDEAAENRRKTAQSVLDEGTDQIVESMPARLSPNPAVQQAVREIIRGANPNGIAGSLLGMAERDDTTGMLASLQVAALVISGGKDEVIPGERTEEMVRQLPDVTWLEIPDAGHMPMLEAPDQVAEGLRELVEMAS